MAQTRRIFDGEDYLRRMNDAAFAAELDRIDHYAAEDDTPDQRKFKNYVRDLQADITQVRLAAWKSYNRGMTPFEIPVDVDHSIQDFLASAEFAVKAGEPGPYRASGGGRRDEGKSYPERLHGMGLAEFTKAWRAWEFDYYQERDWDVLSAGRCCCPNLGPTDDA